MFLAGWTGDSKAVICYRDGRYAIRTPNGASLEDGKIPGIETWPFYERASYLADIGRAIWLERNGTTDVLHTSTETLVELSGQAPSFSVIPLIAPSRDGRYVAMMPTRTGTLWVYDRLLRQWANLGTSTVSPSEDWDYMQPSWDPWFADGKHLVFFCGSELIISSPDGRSKRVLWKTNQTAGLAAPSANGDSVAYVTFQNRPMRGRSDLKFWSTTGVWVISTTSTTPPRRVTGMDLDTTTGLRWLGNDALVFDRIGENLIAMHARIWKVAIR
jgi:hypothetical protein